MFKNTMSLYSIIFCVFDVPCVIESNTHVSLTVNYTSKSRDLADTITRIWSLIKQMEKIPNYGYYSN